MTDLSIVFNRAADLGNADVVVGAAYTLHKATFDALAPFPVLLLEKDRAEFTPQKTLVARAGDRVAGCALLIEIGKIQPLLGAIAGKFGQAAADKMREADLLFDPNKPVFEIGSISVDPAFRNKGIARGLYETAALHAGRNIYAIITRDNGASRAAAKAAGFQAIANSVHTVHFTLEGGRARPCLSGSYEVQAEIFRPA